MAKTRTLIVAGEAFPLAKTGGLGDAITGMARALTEAHMPLNVLLPAYRGVRGKLNRVRTVAALPGLPGGDAALLEGRCPQSGLDYLLLENDALYDRAGLYADENGKEHPDNGVRYAALAHAAVRVAAGLPGLVRPTLVHAHDWHAGLTPLLLRAAGLDDVKSVMTIHNLAFQGLFPMECADAFGIPEWARGDDGAQSWGRLNFLKAGIRYADRVTTVSRTYAREIMTPAFGCGLDDLLRERAGDLLPIPNGIDDVLWNPARDPYLRSHRYGPRDLSNKIHCKAALQREFGLRPDPGATLIGMGNRLTEQKMADVAIQSLPDALDRHPGLQVVILGQGEQRFEQALKDIAARYPGRCAVHIGYDEGIAHRLHAGSDILLHASRFEPFGLTPLYAMRYGSLPIGSRVGGMADTIEDPGPRAPLSMMASANGLLFEGDSPAAMTAAIDRALNLRGHGILWRLMQRNAMTADFGWRSAVSLYASLYRSLVEPDYRDAEPAPAEHPASVAAMGRRTRSGGAMPAAI
ncbi:glycogen synthase GlgA [Achromobacter arsenitoxydans]|uniref:Glycogen synthase n=1 Tax=Achromobacter arsenitoxydans SY8 TaxID=477184 RepID=H0FBI8_9BURK|nr:glycogen synthase GlgA [Achromobacter arsenitoxydans]EHK64453.1 glycogen synthase [Achromobacter arsenitoxydans SY8]